MNETLAIIFAGLLGIAGSTPAKADPVFESKVLAVSHATKVMGDQGFKVSLSCSKNLSTFVAFADKKSEVPSVTLEIRPMATTPRTYRIFDAPTNATIQPDCEPPQ